MVVDDDDDNGNKGVNPMTRGRVKRQKKQLIHWSSLSDIVLLMSKDLWLLCIPGPWSTASA